MMPKGDLGYDARIPLAAASVRVPLSAIDTHGESVDQIEDLVPISWLTNHFALIADAPLVVICESLHA
jgi:hypothetical protein